MTALPEAFARRIAAQLGDEADAYFASLEQPYARGLRLNPQKPLDAPPETLVEGLLEPVPWAPAGRYLSVESVAGAHPLHEAGAFYIQEPSAMLPAALLAVRPGETVLDLCAAPGGKSTQLAAAMAGEGLLVCNEPVPSRAQVLSRNLERMGVPNALAVCADPAQLAARWPLLFDAIQVDAPCSGEGMFRRHPEVRGEWDEAAPARCAERQRAILESALVMLKPGGRLCYSTCTFSREENEELIAALTRDHPELEPAEFEITLGANQKLRSERGAVRLYPHKVCGEGHFAALLQKRSGSGEGSALLPPEVALAAPGKEDAALFRAFWKALSDAPVPEPNARLGELLLCAPPLPPLRGVKVLRAGLALGQPKGRVFAPDHALAMRAPALPLPRIPLDTEQARAYQRGETLPAPEGARGYALVALHGLALGWVKASDGQLKNHYPKGLRRP